MTETTETQQYEVLPPELDAETREEAAQATMLAQVETPTEKSLQAAASLLSLEQTETGIDLIDRRANIAEHLRKRSLRHTNPSDWVLFRDPQGIVTGLLAESGCKKVALLWEIDVTGFPTNAKGIFEPEKNVENGVTELTAAATGTCGITRKTQPITATIRSDESFRGRSVGDDGRIAPRGSHALLADLKSSLYTRLLNKATRILSGITRVPGSELEEAWAGTEKKLEQCRRGSGYGTSRERRGEDVADEGVVEAAKAFGKELLQLTGGDQSAAADLLKEITANPDKGFDGWNSIARITKDWQLQRAKENLAKHPIFGGRQPGED